MSHLSSGGGDFLIACQALVLKQMLDTHSPLDGVLRTLYRASKLAIVSCSSLQLAEALQRLKAPLRILPVTVGRDNLSGLAHCIARIWDGWVLYPVRRNDGDGPCTCRRERLRGRAH